MASAGSLGVGVEVPVACRSPCSMHSASRAEVGLEKSCLVKVTAFTSQAKECPRLRCHHRPPTDDGASSRTSCDHERADRRLRRRSQSETQCQSSVQTKRMDSMALVTRFPKLQLPQAHQLAGFGPRPRSESH